jgi:thiamine biosynthesis lipoprotein
MTSQSTSPVITSCSKDKPWLIHTLGKSTIPRYNAVMSLVVVAIFSLSSVTRAEWVGESRPMMGTEITVYLWHDDQAAGNAAVEAVFTEVARIDDLMSTYKDESLLSKINREAADGPVPAGDELFRLILRSLDISVLTLGAFDVTYDSVGQHYDFRAEQHPDAETIKQELVNIDYRFITTHVDTKSIEFARQGVRINLGGIAKGYAVEQAVDILRRHGVRHAIVTAGGDSRLLGDRRGKPWVVGVRDPRNEGEVAVRIPLENEAISTSGDYERFFDEDGIRYHHIIRPETGLPAGGVHSVTIVGPDAVITDALSTSVFVMGVDQGLRLIATLPDYEGIVIDAGGRMYYSDGLRPPGLEEADSQTPD